MAGQQQPGFWKKRILVPFWVIRVLLMIFIIAIYAWAIKVVSDDVDIRSPSLAAVVIFMLLIVAVLLCDVLAIVLFLRDALNPRTFLNLNSFQTGVWTGIIIMNFISIARDRSNAIGLAFLLIVYATFVILMIYAITQYRKARKQAQRGHYAPAHNPAAPPTQGFNPPAYANAAPYQQSTAYYSHTGAPVEMHAPPYQNHGAAAGYYAEQPVKPAAMV